MIDLAERLELKRTMRAVRSTIKDDERIMLLMTALQLDYLIAAATAFTVSDGPRDEED